MICNKCGANIPDGAAFCPQCGAKDPVAQAQPEQPVQAAQPAPQPQPVQFEQTEQPAAETAAPKANPFGDVIAKIKDNKALTYGIIGGAALIVIIIIIAIIAASAGGGNTSGTRMDGYFTLNVDDESTYFFNGTPIDDTFVNANNTRTNNKGDVLMFTAEDSLYCCKGTKLSEIPDDVTYSTMSNDGSTLAYYSDGEIVIYKNNKSQTIATLDSDKDEILTSIALSPDGSALVYFYTSKDEDSDKETYLCYGWNGSKPVKLGNYTDGWVSNGGKLFYGVTTKGKLYAIKKLDNKQKEDLGKFSYSIGHTSDNSSVVYVDGSDTYAYAPSFEKKIKIANKRSSIVSPSRAVTAISDIRSFHIYSDENVYYVTIKGGKAEKIRLASKPSSYMLSADGKTLIYLDEDTLYKTSAVKKPTDPEVLATGVISFESDSSLSNIYCTTDEDQLIYVKGKGNYDVVDGEMPDAFVVHENGTCVYVLDETCKYARGSKSADCVGLGEVEGFGYYETLLNIAGRAVYAYSDGHVYSSTDGKSFKDTTVEYD